MPIAQVVAATAAGRFPEFSYHGAAKKTAKTETFGLLGLETAAASG
jgi:hypothetical protein